MSPNNNSDPVIGALEKQLHTAEEKLGDQLQLSVDRCQKALNSEKEKHAKGKEAVKAAKLRLRYAKGNNTQLARAKRSLDNIEAKQALLESSHEEAKQATKLAKHELARYQAARKAVAQLDKEVGMGDTDTTATKAAASKAPVKAAAKKASATSATKASPKKAPAKKTATKDAAKPASDESASKKPAKKTTPSTTPKKAAAKKAAAQKPAPAAPEQTPAPKKAAKARKPEPDIERTIPPPSQTTTPKGKKDRLRSLFDAID